MKSEDCGHGTPAPAPTRTRARSDRSRSCSSSRARRAFTLVEFGIVVAVIAVLSAVIIYGAGYIEAARKTAAIDLVLKLHSAARQFAVRNNAGLSYGVDANSANPRNVSLAGLQGAGFIPANLQTPWGTAAGLAVQPDNATNAICAGFTCVQIVVPVGAGACVGNDLTASLQAKALAVTCPAPNGPLTVVFH